MSTANEADANMAYPMMIEINDKDPVPKIVDFIIMLKNTYAN